MKKKGKIKNRIRRMFAMLLAISMLFGMTGTTFADTVSVVSENTTPSISEDTVPATPEPDVTEAVASEDVLAEEAAPEESQSERVPFAIDYDPNDGKIHYGHTGEVGFRPENDINNHYEATDKVVYFPDDVAKAKDKNGKLMFPDYDPKNPYYDYTDMFNEALRVARERDNATVFVKGGVYYFTKSVYLFGYTAINAEAGKTAFVIKPNFQDKDGNPVEVNGFFTNADLSQTYSWYFSKISDIAFVVEGTHDAFKPTSSVQTILDNLCSDEINAVKGFSLFYRVRIKYGAIDNIALSGFYSFLRWCFMDMLTRVTSITVGPTRLVYYGVETNDAFFYDSYYYGGYFTQDDLHEIPTFQIQFSMGTTVFSNSYLENYFFSRSGASTWNPHATYSNLTLKRVCNFVIDTTVTSTSVSGCWFKDCAYNDIEAYFKAQGLTPYDHDTRYYDYAQKKWVYPGTGYVIRDNIVGDNAYDRKHSANHWDGQMLAMIELHNGIAFTQNKIECDSLDWTTLVKLTNSEWTASFTGQRPHNNLYFSDNAFKIREWNYERLMVDDWKNGHPYTEGWHDNTVIAWGEKGYNNSDGTPAMGWIGVEGDKPVSWLKDDIYVSIDLERYVDLSAFLDKNKPGAGYAALGDVGADEQGLWDAGLEDRYYEDMKSGKYEVVSFEEDFGGMGWNSGSNHQQLQKAFDYVATHDAILYIESGTYYTNKPIVLRGGKTYRVVFHGQIKTHRTDEVSGAGAFVMSADDNAPISGYFINPDLYLQNCNTSGFYNVNTDNFYIKVGSIARGVGAFTNCKLKNTVIHEGQIQYCDYGFFYKTVTDNTLIKNVYGTASSWVETEDGISPGDINYRYFISNSDFANSTWKGCWLEFGQFSNGKTLTGAGNSVYRGNVIDYTYNYSFGRNDVVCGNTQTRASYGSIVNHMVNSNFPIDKPDILTDKPMIMYHVGDGLRLIGNANLGALNQETHFIAFDSPGISYKDADGNVVKSISNARVAGNVAYTEWKGEYKQLIPIMPFARAENMVLENCVNNQFQLQHWYLRNQVNDPETEEEEIPFTISANEVRQWAIPGVKTYVNDEYLEVKTPEKEPEAVEQIVTPQPPQDKIYDVPNVWLGEDKQTAYVLYDFKDRSQAQAQALATKMAGYIDKSTIVPYLRSKYNVAKIGEETKNFIYNDIKDLSFAQRHEVVAQTIRYELAKETYGYAFFMDGSREVRDEAGTTNDRDNKNRPTYALVFRDENISGEALQSVSTSFYYDFKLSYAWQGKRPTFIIFSEDEEKYYGVVLGYNGGNHGVFTQTCSFEKDYFNHLVDSRTDKYDNFPQVHFENGIGYNSGSVSALAHIDPASKITRPFNGEAGRSVLGDYTTIPMFDGDIYKYDSAVLGVDLTCEYDDDYKTASLYAIVDFSNIGVDTSQTPALRASSRKVWIGTYDLQGDNKIFGIWAGNKTWLQSAQFEYVPQELSACQHVFVDKITREAECNKEGRIRHTCKNCGYEYEEIIKANKHKFWDKKLKDGTKIRSCRNCELSFITSDPVLYKCEHEYSNRVLKKETCLENGIREYFCTICGEKREEVISAPGHTYVKVETVESTEKKKGYIKYRCQTCGHTYTEELKLKPKPVVDKMTECTQSIQNTDTDKKDVKGSTFAPLLLKATGKSKSVKLTWKKVKKADGYIIYGAQCGKKLKEIKKLGASKKTYTHKKLKKAKYYKYMVVAYKKEKGKKVPIAMSTTVHVPTKGGKYAAPTKVKVKSKTITLKKGKTKSMKASLVLPKGKKSKTHVAKFRYESTNKKVVTVSKKGKLKAKKKGTAYIYVYAQNGVYIKVKVKVK